MITNKIAEAKGRELARKLAHEENMRELRKWQKISEDLRNKLSRMKANGKTADSQFREVNRDMGVAAAHIRQIKGRKAW